MIVFFSEEILGNSIFLHGDEYKHCVKVLRHKVGDEILIFDEYGKLYTSEILKIDKNRVEARIIRVRKVEESRGRVILAIAPTKKADRMEWLLGKAVEIGIHEFWMVKTKRTQMARYKVERLKKIAFSAAKQSLNFKLPIIKEFDNLEDVFEQCGNVNYKFIAHCMDPKEHLMTKEINRDSDVLILIGPEGDFDENEVEQCKNYGFEEISLGPARLRTETAGLVSITIINALKQNV